MLCRAPLSRTPFKICLLHRVGVITHFSDLPFPFKVDEPSKYFSDLGLFGYCLHPECLITSNKNGFMCIFFNTKSLKVPQFSVLTVAHVVDLNFAKFVCIKKKFFILVKFFNS